MVASMAQEAVGHEGCEEGDVPVGLLHLHLPQLHLDGLQETQGQGSPLSPLPSPLRSSPFSILQSRRLFPARTQLTPHSLAVTGNISHYDQRVLCGGAQGLVWSSALTPGTGYTMYLCSQAFFLSCQHITV